MVEFSGFNSDFGGFGAKLRDIRMQTGGAGTHTLIRPSLTRKSYLFELVGLFVELRRWQISTWNNKRCKVPRRRRGKKYHIRYSMGSLNSTLWTSQALGVSSTTLCAAPTTLCVGGTALCGHLRGSKNQVRPNKKITRGIDKSH